jgi:opacity protein-like surface antigen
LIVGVRQQQASFFIAGEIFTSVHQFSIKRKGNNFFVKDPDGILPPGSFGALDFEVDVKYTNGVSVLLGKDLTSTVDVFLKLDFFLSKFIIKYANSAAPSNHGEEKKWLFGYAPGVGVQVKLTDNIATRFDYSYRIYNEFNSKNLSRETGLTAPSTVITGKILPRIHQFTLALIYKF